MSSAESSGAFYPAKLCCAPSSFNVRPEGSGRSPQSCPLSESRPEHGRTSIQKRLEGRRIFAEFFPCTLGLGGQKQTFFCCSEGLVYTPRKVHQNLSRSSLGTARFHPNIVKENSVRGGRRARTPHRPSLDSPLNPRGLARTKNVSRLPFRIAPRVVSPGFVFVGSRMRFVNEGLAFLIIALQR